jgi:hypothetical protein
VTPKRKVAKKETERTPVQPSVAESIIVDEEEETPAQKSQVDNQFMSYMKVLLEEEVELYFWDVQNEDFRNDGIVTARITQQTNANFVYWLLASNDKGTILAHRVQSDMNQRFSHKMLSLTWNHLGEDFSQSSWLFRFHSQEDFAKAAQTFTQCLWETLHQLPWGKIKVDSTTLVAKMVSDFKNLARRAELCFEC